MRVIWSVVKLASRRMGDIIVHLAAPMCPWRFSERRHTRFAVICPSRARISQEDSKRLQPFTPTGRVYKIYPLAGHPSSFSTFASVSGTLVRRTVGSIDCNNVSDLTDAAFDGDVSSSDLFPFDWRLFHRYK